jgi:hypothetical protein
VLPQLQRPLVRLLGLDVLPLVAFEYGNFDRLLSSLRLLEEHLIILMVTLRVLHQLICPYHLKEPPRSLCRRSKKPAV